MDEGTFTCADLEVVVCRHILITVFPLVTCKTRSLDKMVSGWEV